MRVHAQDGGAPTRRLQDIHEDLDRRGLTRAVGADQRVRAPVGRREAQSLKSVMAAESLPQVTRLDQFANRLH